MALSYRWRSFFLSLVVVASSGYPAWADTAPSAPRYNVVDVMPQFFKAFDSGSNLATRLDAFKTLVIEPNEELFSNGEFALDDPHLAWYLMRVAPHIDALRAIDSRLAAELPGIEERFDDSFPEMRGAFVGIEPSFGHFDGQTHDRLDGSPGVFFGADGILLFDGPSANLGVLVSHEFFHAYQAQVGQALLPLYTSRPTLVKTWTEGLAAYVSMKLTPGATDADGLISTTLARLDGAKKRELACIVRDRSANAAGNDQDLFDTSEHPDGLPARGGYLIGFSIARDLAKTHSLDELAKLGGNTLATLFDHEVSAICGS